MGGASSDAAAALRASISLWQRRLSSSEIDSIAAQLGSDVPFFLKGGTALATGRGEQTRRLPPLPLVWFVVAVPDASIERKTARMYGQLCPADFSDGSAVDAIASSIASGKLPDWSSMSNAFVRPLHEMRPDFQALHDAFDAAGAPFVAVTGAGVGHFTAVADRERAEAIRAALISRYPNHLRTFVCRPVETSPDPIVISRS
jgi:4-diphosphocytidyl-2-C-methyl-D-erythritol kinase